ncbi:MAG: SpoIIE family protein phosphatase [Acidimicrobiia bacterium]
METKRVLIRRRRRRREATPPPDSGGGVLEHALEGALESARIGVWSWDGESRRVRWAASMERLCGLEPGSFGGTLEEAVGFVHPDDRELVAERLTAVTRDAAPTGLRYRLVRADGDVRWVDNRVLRLDDGTLIGIAIDVTEQRDVEEELRNREAEARLALDVGGMGTWRWDRVTNEVSWSPELEAMYGYESGTFPGTFEAFVELIHPDDREHVLEAMRGILEHGGEIAHEHRIVLPNGEVRWTEGRGHEIPGTDGREWIGIGADITSRKEAETERARLLALEQLARAEAEQASGALEATLARLDTLLENAPVGFGFCDTKFRYVRVNRPLAEMNGVPVEEHLGRTVAEVVPHVWESAGRLYETVLDSGEPLIDREMSGQTPAAPGVVRHWLVSVYPVTGPDGERIGIGSVVVEITERKRAELATQLIARASELFSSELDLDTMIDRVVRLAIPDFADSCHLYLRGPEGDGRRVAVADVDPELEELLADAGDRYPLDLEGDLPTARALRSGHAVRMELITDELRQQAAQSPEHLEILQRHGVCSVITTPLEVRGERLGALVLMYTERSARRYQRNDVALAEELAHRFADAIERAQLSREAERARAHIDLLASVGELLTVELDSRARIEAMARVVLPAFADVCVVHVADADGTMRIAAFAAANADRQAQIDAAGPWRAVNPEPGTPWTEAVQTGEPVLAYPLPRGLVGKLTLTGERARDPAPEFGVRSLLSVPLPGGRTGPIGAVSFAYAESGRRYSEEDVALARELARRAAPALGDALRFEQEQATAEALQRSLLPDRLPELMDAEHAARYVPGSDELKIGGDWYDVLPLPDGHVLAAIGDVVGHGIRAAASMGRIRNALDFCAIDGLTPGAILRRLNDNFSALGDGDMATVLIAVYEPRSGTLRFASAGHPPPLVQRPGEPPEFLEGSRGAPLCAVDDMQYPEVEVAVPPGTVLVLYTDGLIERRGESLDEGLGRLARAVADAPEKLDELADHLLDRLLAGASPDDDVALLALRLLPAPAELVLRLSAQPRELGKLRARLGEWLERLGAAPSERGEITLAVSEAAANAVEHAYGLRDGDFIVEGSSDDGRVVVVVRDFGRWFERATQSGGRGVSLMRSLMDDVDIDRGVEGTTVTLRRRLRRDPAE